MKLLSTKALTAINMSRNWALRKAGELVKAASTGSEVKIDMKLRTVKIGDEICFKQEACETKGKFIDAWTRLTLP